MTMLEKRGHWVTDPKKGSLGKTCEIAQNPANFNTFFEIFGAICKFDDSARTILMEKAKRGGH